MAKKKEQDTRILQAIVTYDVLDNLDGKTVKEGIEIIKSIVKTFKQLNDTFKWHTFKFRKEYSNGYDTNTYLELYAERYETEEERKLAEEDNKKIKKKHEQNIKEQELRELARLKKKYEKSRTNKKDNT